MLNTEFYLIDELPGAGKTTAIIQELNRSDDDNHYIYVTPYLDECKRFVRECNREFHMPAYRAEFDNSKIKHSEYLLSQGLNLCTTHSALQMYTKQILEYIKKWSYILIMDEACEVINEVNCKPVDIELLERAGYLVRNGYIYSFVGPEEYIEKRGALYKSCRKAITSNLYCYEEDNSGKMFYYLTPPEILSSFSKVLIMTFMFSASDLCQMLKINGWTWQRLYIKCLDGVNNYAITDEKQPVQDYVYQIPNNLHIYEHEYRQKGRGRQMKDINHWTTYKNGYPEPVGFKPTVRFYQRHSENKTLIKEIKRNQETFFRNMIKEHGGDKELCMWTVFNDHISKVAPRGYDDCFVVHNAKATNDYSHKAYLSFACSLFVNPHKINYYRRHGIEYNRKDYALSTIIQWCWRSRLRKKDQEVWLYVVSKEERDWLKGFLDDLKEGKL